MPVEENGFLGEEISQTRKYIIDEHSAFFNLIYSLNRLAYKTRDTLQINNQNPQEIMAACLLIRLHEGLQAATVLLELGLLNDVKVLLRSLLEAYFHLKLVCKDRGYLEEYIKGSELKNIRKILKAKRKQLPAFIAHFKSMPPATLAHYEQEKDALKQYNITIEKLAEKADMSDWYDTVYSVLSDVTHTSSRVMECYLDLDEKKNVRRFIQGPRLGHDFKMVLHLTSDILGHTLDSVDKLFQLNMASDLGVLATRSNEIAQSLTIQD